MVTVPAWLLLAFLLAAPACLLAGVAAGVFLTLRLCLEPAPEEPKAEEPKAEEPWDVTWRLEDSNTYEGVDRDQPASTWWDGDGQPHNDDTFAAMPRDEFDRGEQPMKLPRTKA